MIAVTHVGGDRLRIETRDHVLFTDQPIEDGGEDTAPTPTEMFVASLAACIGFYAERFLRRNGLTTQGLQIVADYRWAEDPHRVGEIAVEVQAPGLTDAKRDAFERVIGHCTVHNTLVHPPNVRTLIAAGQQAIPA